MAVRQLLQLKPMAHRERASRRFWIYIVGGFLVPGILQAVLSTQYGFGAELGWLLALFPAFLLSLHYGAKGSVVAVLIGLIVFVGVQYVVPSTLSPDEWSIVAPIAAAYTTIAVSVGWLSETLHGYYQHTLQNERMAAIGQLAVTINHRANNALASIVAESGLLLLDADTFSLAQKGSLESINKAAMRIARDVKKIGKLRDAPIITYAGEIKMVDLDNAATRSKPNLPTV